MSGHTLTLGAGGQAPAWVADPTHGVGPFGPGGFLILKCCINSTLPYLAGTEFRAMSVAWYLKLTTTPPGTESYIFRFTGGTSPSANDFRAMLTAAGKVKCYNQWTGDDDITESTTALSSGSEVHCVMTRAASNSEGSQKSRLYINGVLEHEITVGGNRIAANAQKSFLWGADNTGFTGQTGAPVIIGRTLVYDGELSAVQAQNIYVQYRTAYPGLPPL